MTSSENRIIALEEEVAHLRLQNEELSAEILSQWKQVDLLQKKLAQLEERFAGLEDGPEIGEANVKPPHW